MKKMAGKKAEGSSGKGGKVTAFGTTPIAREARGGGGGMPKPKPRVGVGIKHPKGR